MLVLTVCVDEAVRIGPDITVMLCRASSGRARLGIEAPADVAIERIGRWRKADAKPGQAVPVAGPARLPAIIHACPRCGEALHDGPGPSAYSWICD